MSLRSPSLPSSLSPSLAPLSICALLNSTLEGCRGERDAEVRGMLLFEDLHVLVFMSRGELRLVQISQEFGVYRLNRCVCTSGV